MLCELHQECEYGWKSGEVDKENLHRHPRLPGRHQEAAGRALPHHLPAARGAPALHRPGGAVVLQGAEVC